MALTSVLSLSLRVQEAERRERVAQEALKSAHRSKLPPRMQQHKETQRAKKAAEAERIQAEIDAELTLQPRITEGVPDFDRLHNNFERTLQRKRQSFKSTTPRPFRMESEPYRLMQREVHLTSYTSHLYRPCHSSPPDR